MSRTWLLRGGAAVVLAVLIGAWGLGVAGGDDDKAAPKEESSVPAPSDSPTVTEAEPATVDESTSPSAEATRSEGPVDEASTEASTDAVTQVVDKAPTSRSTRGPKPSPTPKQPSPTPRPSSPPSSSPTPTQPGTDCRDLANLVNCVLAPITTKP